MGNKPLSELTIVSHFKEVPEYVVDDGSHSIYLSTKGINSDEVPANLVRFLNFVHAPLDKSCDNFHDSYVEQLQDAIVRVKNSREMGSRYMLFEEMLKEERQEGALQQARTTISNLLSEIGPVTASIQGELTAIQDLDLLNKLILIAAKSESLEQFSSKCKKLM